MLKGVSIGAWFSFCQSLFRCTVKLVTRFVCEGYHLNCVVWKYCNAECLFFERFIFRKGCFVFNSALPSCNTSLGTIIISVS